MIGALRKSAVPMAGLIATREYCIRGSELIFAVGKVENSTRKLHFECECGDRMLLNFSFSGFTQETVNKQSKKRLRCLSEFQLRNFIYTSLAEKNEPIWTVSAIKSFRVSKHCERVVLCLCLCARDGLGAATSRAGWRGALFQRHCTVLIENNAAAFWNQRLKWSERNWWNRRHGNWLC